MLLPELANSTKNDTFLIIILIKDVKNSRL